MKIKAAGVVLVSILLFILFGRHGFRANQVSFLNDPSKDAVKKLGDSALPLEIGNRLNYNTLNWLQDGTAIYLSSQPVSIREETFNIQFEKNKLTVDTKRMVMMIEAGAIIYAQDKISGDIFVNSSAYLNRPSGTKSFIGFISKDKVSNHFLRWPMPSSQVYFSRLDTNHFLLTYHPLFSKNIASTSQLEVYLEVDPTYGEIILQVVGIEGDSALRPYAIDLPIMNTTTPEVILGSGAKYSRAEADATDQTTYHDFGLYSPTMVVVQGPNAAMAAWSETTEFAPEYIRLDHKPGYDHIILHAEQDPKQVSPQRIISPPWRIGMYSTWVKAAKRWREKFEDRTGATPLWRNRTLWVRKIHATFFGLGQFYGANETKYSELASKAPPEKILYFIWNGDRIVLFGDHSLIDKITRPTPTEVEIIKKYGWRLLLYHPYNLIYSEKGETKRLDYLARKGWLPSGYRFSPDFESTPQNWQHYWSNIKANYYDDSQFFVLHPGSILFRNYFMHNFTAYCTLHRADGAYLDILGVNLDFLFRNGRRVMEGDDYVLGECNTLRKVARELPHLGVMSEYQSPWVLPFAFYSWEGSVTHLRQNARANTRINHPLRVGLCGSYSWMRESNTEYIDDVTAALLGTLPEISLVGDYKISKERALWSQARAQLFCDQELFNDLPDKWEEDVLAYYRSRSGNWFKFKYLGSSYGYVEVLPNGDEIVRLSK